MTDNTTTDGVMERVPNPRLARIGVPVQHEASDYGLMEETYIAL